MQRVFSISKVLYNGMQSVLVHGIVTQVNEQRGAAPDQAFHGGEEGMAPTGKTRSARMLVNVRPPQLRR